MIREIRLLPPLAIARLGASPTPLENYNVVVDDAQPLAFRALKPARTLVVDRATGTITARDPQPNARVRFKDDDNLVRPVAPFVEVWCDRGNGTFVPLTTAILQQERLTAADVRWRVRVANIKAWRRTRDTGDRIDADTQAFSGHGIVPLTGTCPNFVRDKTIAFGDVQYILPTGDFPQIRLRFTPAHGYVFGATKDPDDRNVRDVVYNSRTGRWSRYRGNDPIPTYPGGIFANRDNVSLGYLDDACDGLVEVELTAGGNRLAAHARIASGPPDYAPDSFPVRTVADELEQALLGPSVDPANASHEMTAEIVRRAFETVRLQNTAYLNGNVGGNNMAAHDVRDPEEDPPPSRIQEPIMAPALVDNLALRALHQSIFTALRGDTAAWFGEVLREYTEVADITNRGRRKMPAMMRGADGNHLALTRRQVDNIRKASSAARTMQQPEAAAAEREVAPVNLTAEAAAAPPGKPLAVQAMEGDFAPDAIGKDALLEQLAYRAVGNPPGTLPTTAISNCFPGLEFDFRNAWRHVFVEVELHELEWSIVENDELTGVIESIEVDGQEIPITGEIRVPGPGLNGEPPIIAPDRTELERSNALAALVVNPGRKVRARIRGANGRTRTRDLTVRGIFAPGTAAIAKEAGGPGELTAGLCSPWQNDYRECGCYYWAASRPDYVNVEAGPDAVSVGHNWLQVRDETTPKRYIPDTSGSGLVTYIQLFRDWQRRLRFIVGGSDSE